MQDLTTGSITRHLLKTTSYMLVMMVFQTLYFLIDLYWVGRLGTEAVAGVGIAGNLSFIVLAISQMLGVGTTTVVAHACGRKDRDDAQHLFNQSQALSCVAGALFLVVAMLGRMPYARAMGADPETTTQAAQYLKWFIPAMALQFPFSSMGAALRGTGNFKPGMVVATATVLINMALAPFLIFGWVTGRAYGVAGAAMSTLVSIVIGIVWMATYFTSKEAFLHFSFSHWRPHFGQWKRMLSIGLPAGFEFGMMALYQFIVYTVARPFGAASQAGFGIGMRVIQAGFMPVVALGFSVSPVAGQNFGARLGERVKATFKDGARLAVAWQIFFIVLVQFAAAGMVRVFSKDPAVVAVGDEYLRVISWSFIASGLIFVSSSMFQAMGNTLPSLIASGARMVVLTIPVFLLARLSTFQLHWVWYLSLATAYFQLGLVLLLLRREFARRLDFGVAAPPISVQAPVAETVS
ncbi:MAG TPA: MATE family efflux transporter [Gemmatimonadaceae bacterium]|jgi:putative MATE family efflux protein|nr:MATE family efflux transporter [Gemmatimonadaceae bacterium]